MENTTINNTLRLLLVAVTLSLSTYRVAYARPDAAKPKREVSKTKAKTAKKQDKKTTTGKAKLVEAKPVKQTPLKAIIKEYKPQPESLLLESKSKKAPSKEKADKKQNKPDQDEEAQPTEKEAKVPGTIELGGSIAVGAHIDAQPYTDNFFAPSLIDLKQDKTNKRRFKGPTLKSAELSLTKTLPFLDNMPGGNNTVDVVAVTSFNSGTFSLKRMYIKHKNFVIGHTDSNFCNGDAYPKTCGAPSSAVFSKRGPQLTWKHEPIEGVSYAVGVEKSSHPFIADEKVRKQKFQHVVPSDNIPALTANVRYSNDLGHIQLGTLLRVYDFYHSKKGEEKTVMNPTGGANLSGVYNVVPKKTIVKASLVIGSGIASWILDFAVMPKTAYKDVYFAPKGKDLGAIEQLVAWGGFVGVEHYWMPEKFYSVLVLNALGTYDNDKREAGAYKGGVSAALSTTYKPIKPISMSIEWEIGRKYVVKEEEFLKNVDKSNVSKNAHRITGILKYSLAS